MGIEPTLITVVSSITFVIIGSLVFNVAAILSGFSIYRELSQDHARLITIAVGGTLFILSPLGYLIFYPEEFVSQTGQRYYSSELWGLVWSWEAMVPFIFAFVGLGLVYGSLSIIGMRWMLLDWLRGIINVPFRIYSYELTGDEYLRSIERNSPVTVTTQDHVIYGRLGIHSKGNEKEELELRNYEIYPAHGTCDSKAHNVVEKIPIFDKDINRRMLLKGSNIRSISVSDYVATRHEERESHVTQGYYLGLAALGFVLLAISTYMTGGFVRNLDSKRLHYTEVTQAGRFFHQMPSFYGFWNTLFLIAALSILYFASYFPAKDFHQTRRLRRLIAAYAINGKFLFLILLHTSTALATAIWILWNGLKSPAEVILPNPWMPDFSEFLRGLPDALDGTALPVQSTGLPGSEALQGIIALALFLLWCFLAFAGFIAQSRYNNMREIFDDIIRTFENIQGPNDMPGIDVLRAVLAYLKEHIDVNAEDNSYDRLRDQLKTSRYAPLKLNDRLFKPLEKVVGPKADGVFRGEEYNVIAAFHRLLESKPKKADLI